MIEFVHPGEETAWNALLDNKVFQVVVDVFQSVYTDLTSFGTMQGRNFLVTESTMPDVYRLYQMAARRLGIEELPPLYVQMDYAIKIQTLGTDGDCAVVINSACLEECSREQLLALFGQELTHIRYGHLRVLNMDAMLDTILTKVPWVGSVASQTLKALLLQWKEYAYYTADRGAAIAAGDKLYVFENLSMAMGKKLDKAGIASLSAKDNHEMVPVGQSNAARMVLQIMINSVALPFGMWRIRELGAWDVDAAQFQKICDSLAIQEKQTSAARKTVDTMDHAARGIYRGAVKTAQAVKTGREELEAYVEENRPVWENNLSQAKDKTIEAVRTGKQEVTDYFKEKAPEWKESAAETFHAGVTKLQDLRNKYKQKK